MQLGLLYKVLKEGKFSGIDLVPVCPCLHFFFFIKMSHQWSNSTFVHLKLNKKKNHITCTVTDIQVFI